VVVGVEIEVEVEVALSVVARESPVVLWRCGIGGSGGADKITVAAGVVGEILVLCCGACDAAFGLVWFGFVLFCLAWPG
jgi:hypothetical protein